MRSTAGFFVLNRISDASSAAVVEEGMDVQACSFVVAFDGLTSIKGYIQMKGRGRKQNAKFYVFEDPSIDKKSQLQLAVAQKMEKRLQVLIEKRMGSNARSLLAPLTHVGTTPSAALPKELAALQSGCYNVGEGSVDIQSAKSLLHRYFLSIPMDPFVRKRKETLLPYIPSFEEDRLILPVHLPSDVRNVELPVQYRERTRRERQKILSLMACVRLHSHGLLNDRLLPLTRKDMQARILQVAATVVDEIEPLEHELDDVYRKERRFWIYRLQQTSPALCAYQKKLNGKGHCLGLLTTERIELMQPSILQHVEFGAVEITMVGPTSVVCSEREAEILQQIFVFLLNQRWRRGSRNNDFQFRQREEYDSVGLRYYLIGLLFPSGALDWDLMEELLRDSTRSKEERTEAVRQQASCNILQQARMWSPTYNERVRYVVFGLTGNSCDSEFPAEKEGVKTYKDYFRKFYSLEVTNDCPLFGAELAWKPPSGLTIPAAGDENLENAALEPSLEAPRRTSVQLPLVACLEAPLANASINLLCLCLPQALFLVERQQKAGAFIAHCERHLPTLGGCLRKLDISKVATALTSKSCNSNDNYDKWEWVGDAVLKLLQSDSIMKSPDFVQFIRVLHEGELTLLRSGKCAGLSETGVV
jgi:Dicer dimerisation domain